MARRMTWRWPGAMALALALCASHATAQEESPQRVLPSRRYVGPPQENDTNAAAASPVRIVAKRHEPGAPPPDGAPADAPQPPVPLPQAESPAPDGAPPPDQPPVPEAAAPPPGEAPEPGPKPADTAQESVLPVAPPLERFKPLWLSSPFSRNILPENKPAAAAAEFTLLGIGGLGEKWCALVLDKKSQPQRRLLLFDDASEAQDRLVKVTESPNLDQVTAEVVIGGAPYTVRYDIASLKAQVATPGPGQPHVPAPAIKPAPGQPHAPQPPPPPPSPVRVLPRRRYYPSPSNSK